MAQGTFHYSTHLFLSDAHGTRKYKPNIQVDHPPNHHVVRLQPCPVIDNHYTLSVRMLGTKRRRIRYDTTIWFRDEEVFSIQNEEMIVDAGRWMQMGVINLHDELTELEETTAGILILPGVEEHNDDDDELRRHFILSYMRVSINIVEVEEEEVERVPQRVATFAKWAVWTLLGFAMQHALGD